MELFEWQMSRAHYSLQVCIKCVSANLSQVDSLSLSQKTDALSIGQMLHVRSKIIFSPEFNVAISVTWSVGIHRQKHKFSSPSLQNKDPGGGVGSTSRRWRLVGLWVEMGGFRGGVRWV